MGAGHDSQIQDATWHVIQSKTGNAVPVPLHPLVLAILEDERRERRKSGVVDPRRPLLTNSRGKPWTPTGFGASWRTELIRLKLKPHRKEDLEDGAFRATLHGLRHTNATVIANSVARHPEVFGGIQRVQSMLGHLSKRMSEHYARRAEVEHMNRETMLLLPNFGKHPDWLGKPESKKDAK
ncbi:tyrosine-type recombinase/integrase [Salipiger abyssi]|uniref:tyrosine-type recombinase/integrase n=1 Tax=Salipiger abyssi TaxID=1250539 RepID=UPI001AC7A04F|nr:tyrosine-type recombinase/integrase [Salipiger abyssi]MBN9890497.1 tyrosine-type recombinase/integrase [Salipiger abyssi]